MRPCRCGKNNYEWSVDESSRSWLKCADCGSNFFDEGIGVILINWDFTTFDEINLDDVLKSNARGNAVLQVKMGWKKVRPKYCPEHGNKLFLYYCFSCKKFHWPYKIWKNADAI